MLELAGHFANRPLRANEIAQNQNISLKYLENLLASLKAAGLIRSVRGKNGGYMLARGPEEITLHDILTVLEGSLGFVHCTESQNGCDRLAICVTREVWITLKDATDRILKSTTLHDLLERQQLLNNELQAGSR